MHLVVISSLLFVADCCLTGGVIVLTAGVPISDPVAGVAVGVVTRCDSQTSDVLEHRILTDLLVSVDFCPTVKLVKQAEIIHCLLHCLVSYETLLPGSDTN